MKCFTCFLTIVILGLANAQTFTMGNCDPNIETMQNFDETKFAGRWYEVQQSHNLAEEHATCMVYTLYLSSSPNHTYNVPITFEFVNDKQKGEYFMFFNPQDLPNGKMSFKPGFITGEQPLWVLHTDYTSYGVTYSCIDSYQGKLEYVWIVTRSSKPDEAIIRNAKGIIKARGIGLKMINISQNC